MLISTSIDELSIFSDPLRSAIIGLLADEQLCTCHLVELTGARQPTISHHLKLLREAGLVETEPVGRNTYYRLIPDAVEQLAGLVGDLAERSRSAKKMRRPCG